MRQHAMIYIPTPLDASMSSITQLLEHQASSSMLEERIYEEILSTAYGEARICKDFENI